MMELQHLATLFIALCLWKNGEAISPEWKLVWSDEFNGTAINPQLWNFEYGDGCQIAVDLCGWGNGELQWYTDSTDNAFVTNGHLVLQAKQQEMQGKHYTSARMITRGKGDWQYGRIEVSAKFPSGTGILPLIWMLPTYEKYGRWPNSGEIDIAAMHKATEGIALLSQIIFGTSYADMAVVAKESTTEKGQPKFSDAFHTFALEWWEDHLTWFINNIEVYTYDAAWAPNYYTYPFNERFHLILSLAVGGKVGGVPDNTPFPKRLEIDYVRVFQK